METGNRSEGEPSRRLPERMFAVGEEPVGVRVTPYHKPFAITDIIRALDEDEVELLQRSPFGKLVEIAEKPTFSGRFGRYIISRQLKVKRKYEAWFLFAGKPIRFSMREFAVVTGLNCGKFPPRCKRKITKAVNERPYWSELFGTLIEVPVNSVVRMLKNRSVTDKETRMKYAYLALLAAVVLPTSHTPRISHVHAEKIKDLEEFLAYPWGRLSFQLLISSIKERNEVSLSQNTIALKGFVLALQLVMIEAVPALTEAVQDGGSSGSDNDFYNDEDHVDDDRNANRSICPANARETDIAGKASVLSIISVGNEEYNGEGQFGWSDDEEDDAVQYLVDLVKEGYVFNGSIFTGGSSRTDVERMREESKNNADGKKTKKQKPNKSTPDVPDGDSIATVVQGCLAGDFNRLSEQVNRLSADLSTIATDMKIFRAAFSTMETTIVTNVQDTLKTFEKKMLKSFSKPSYATPSRRRTEDESDTQFGVDVRGATPRTDVLAGTGEVTPGFNGEGSSEDTIRESDTPSPVHADVIIDTAIRFAANVISPGAVDENIAARSPDEHSPAERVITPQAASPEPPSPNVISQEAAAATLDPRLLFEEPQFSLGLTQEEANNDNVPPEVVNEESSETGMDVVAGVIDVQGGPPCQQFRKSKRHKVLPKGLVGDYQCDKKLLARAWEAHVARSRSGDDNDDGQKYVILLQMLKTPFSFMVNGARIESKDIAGMVEKSSHLPSKVVDMLIHHTRFVYDSASDQVSSNRTVFFDTKFVAQMSKTYGRFCKGGKKEGFKFPPSLWDTFTSTSPTIDLATRFYFPFNFDKTHWVGVCFDITSSQLQVLDCNIAKRGDVTMFKDLAHFAEMFPHMIRQIGKQNFLRDLKPLSMDRPRIIPQINNQFYSGVTSVLLIQAHAFGGVEICKCITPNVVDAEVERLAVSLVHRHHGIT